jgi:hypothetical protein
MFQKNDIGLFWTALSEILKKEKFGKIRFSLGKSMPREIKFIELNSLDSAILTKLKSFLLRTNP